MTIPAVLAQAAKTDRKSPALVGEEGSLTYAAAYAAAQSVAARLRSGGCVPGDRVLLAVETGISYPIALCGIMQAGGWAVPVNPGDPAAKKRWIVEDAGCEWAVTTDLSLEVGLGPERVLTAWEVSNTPGFRHVKLNPDSEAMIIYTSGTTGQPKGVVLTHRNLLLNAADVTRYLNLRETDTVLLFLPTGYSYALSQLLTAMLASARIVFLPTMFHPAYVVQAIKEHGVTGFGGVPTTFNLLCDYLEQKGEKLPSLRFAMNAGGPLLPSTVTKLVRLLPDVQIFNCYGCTEIGPRATYLPPAELPRRPNCIGKPLPSVQLRVVGKDGADVQPGEIGEITLSGRTLMKGYYRNPEATTKAVAPEGFHTGDLATVDSEGFVYFKGRKDDIFRCGAAKVSPVEIEEVLLRHPDVLEAVVLGVAHQILGMVPKAILVPKAGRNLDEPSIRRWCMEALPQHCVPRVIEIRERLEKSLSGKLLRAQIG